MNSTTMDEEKTGTTRKRTRARELALKALYMADLRPDLKADDLNAFIKTRTEEDEVRSFAMRLIEDVVKTKADLDAVIQSIAVNWEIKRMPAIDRNVLRIAACEILYMEDIPRKVSINEAIDIAKKYSTAESGSFVNGILDKINPPE